jgi:hypothetical protein
MKTEGRRIAEVHTPSMVVIVSISRVNKFWKSTIRQAVLASWKQFQD